MQHQKLTASHTQQALQQLQIVGRVVKQTTCTSAVSPDRNIDRPPLRAGLVFLAAPKEGGVPSMLLLEGTGEGIRAPMGLHHALPSALCPRGVLNPLTLRLATGLLAATELPHADGLVIATAAAAESACGADSACCATFAIVDSWLAGVSGALGTGCGREGVTPADV